MARRSQPFQYSARVAAAHGADPDAIEKTHRDSAEASLFLIRALGSESPVIRKPGDPLTPSGLAAGFDRNYSALVVPMRLGAQPLGLISLAHHTVQPRNAVRPSARSSTGVV